MLTPTQIKAIRTNLKMSQEEMAHALGVTGRTVSRWESGEAKLTSSSVEKFGQFLYKRVNDALPRNVLSRLRQLRREASHEVTLAIRRGELPKLVGIGRTRTRCVDCSKSLAEHYDHRDYTKPLLVDPVCQVCNFRRGCAVLTLQHIWK